MGKYLTHINMGILLTRSVSQTTAVDIPPHHMEPKAGPEAGASWEVLNRAVREEQAKYIVRKLGSLVSSDLV